MTSCFVNPMNTCYMVCESVALASMINVVLCNFDHVAWLNPLNICYIVCESRFHFDQTVLILL